MLLLEGQGEAVDNGPEDLEQLGNTVESLGLVGELEEDVVDRPSDERPQVEELAVDAMQGGLEEVSLARVLRVKELQELQNETVVDISLRDVRVEVLAFDKAEEELVDDLNMRPCNLQHGLILLRIESLALGVHGRRDRAEQVLGEHLDHPGVHGFGDDLSVVRDVV